LGHITEGYWAPQLLQKHGLGLVSQSQFFDKKLNVSLFGKYFGYDASIKQSEVVKGIVLYNDVKTSASALGYGLAGSYRATYFLTINASLEKANRLPESDEILGDGFRSAPPNCAPNKATMPTLVSNYIYLKKRATKYA
jgi:hypothetical protein